ncbi:hypothetical protein GUITHDRAFT_104806 [Guillardia theta CCMP2712]|uniref:Uncharacterized protein n=1 Tax=Guillardia theta (strain CCMP2712) TaxID=905079 RepID=L1JL89_GUITC|nr:hypothetical protein GUITHDRAFT_104806 [Guillardia theta CCMP2712]EKX49276.1 hypothetical protein GUITHDRAFT_104806 [Guillardia theta CCMP2712]|eukprot:XP_005836256.1 hypothetical protein GUITHDRAFT_104806 [Guillardia theta CCMP2712]
MSNISSKVRRSSRCDAQHIVRAVYEALEMRKNKQALKLLGPLLQKKAGNPQLLILKALALVRVGKKEEALQLAHELKAQRQVEGDETLLNNLAIVFREAGAASEATECFKKQEPNNEELALCLFAAYGRERDFLKQQQLAQKLQKQFGREQYALWAIVATTLQVMEGAPPKLLFLTERQMAKRAEESKLNTYEEMRLYLEILERQGKLAEAVQMLESPIGDNYTSKIERLQTKARLLFNNGNWKEARAVYMELMTVDEGQVKGKEEWSHVRGVLDCIMKEKNFPVPSNAPQGGSVGGMSITIAPVENPKEDFEWIMQEGEKMIAFLIEHQTGEIKSRTPHLAAVELYTRLLAFCPAHLSIHKDILGKSIDAVYSYVEMFCTKDMCAYDLVVPLQRFPVDQHQIIMDKLKTLGGSGPHKDASDDLESVCLRFGTMTKISRMLGLHTSIVSDDSKFRQEVQEHLHAALSCVKRLKRKPGYPRDRTPSDDNTLVAARLLFDKFCQTRDECYLVDASIVARWGLHVSPTNFQFKLLLLKLYRTLGAFEAMHEVYTELDVKHILWDTLTYLILPASFQWCHINKVREKGG